MPLFPRHKWHLHNGGDPALTARILIHCYPRMQLLRFDALPPRLPPDIGASSLLIPPPSRCTRRRARALRSSRPSSGRRNSPSAAHTCSSRVQPPCLASSSRTPCRSSASSGFHSPIEQQVQCRLDRNAPHCARLSWMEQLQRMRPSSLLRRLHSISV